MSTRDLKASTHTSSEEVVDIRARVRGVYFIGDGTAGSVVLKDGGSGGTAKLTLAVPAAATPHTVMFDDGIVFATDVYITLTNVTSATIFYE